MALQAHDFRQNVARLFEVTTVIHVRKTWRIPTQGRTRESVVEFSGAPISRLRDAETTFGSRLCLFTSDLNHLLPINREVNLLFLQYLLPLFLNFAYLVVLCLCVSQTSKEHTWGQIKPMVCRKSTDSCQISG